VLLWKNKFSPQTILSHHVHVMSLVHQPAESQMCSFNTNFRKLRGYSFFSAPKLNITYLLNDHNLESSEPKDSLPGKSTIEPVPELMGLGQELDSSVAVGGTVAWSVGRGTI